VTFPPQKPQPFERSAVAGLRAGVVGCYGLFRRERWVYIGTGDIRARLLAHLDGDRPWLAGDEPTHWVVIETSEYETAARDLVIACAPSCIVRSPAVTTSSGGPS
jgi:hypothetical protein